MDEQIKLLHDLLLKLGVTLTLAVILFGVYFSLARKRARKVPLTVFTIFAVTVVLYIVLLLDDSDLIEAVDLWQPVRLWTRFVAYLGTAFLLIKGFDLLFVEDYLMGKKGFYVPDLLRLLFVIATLAVSVLVFLRVLLGINVITLVAIPTVLTAIIGFALQDTIKRLFAGLQLGELVRVGEWISVAGREGRVIKVDLGYLSILTREDDLVLIPNNVVLEKDILNYHQPSPRHARTVTVNAGYGAPPLEVLQILLDAAKAAPGVLRDPAPRAYVSAFKDATIEYRVRYWIDDYVKGVELEGQILTYVWYAFKRHGISLPMSQPPDAQTGAQRQRIADALEHIDFLAVLSPEERSAMAEQATIRQFLPGEVVIHQGEEGSELFFILAGHAEVRVGEGTDSVLATLNPLQFFGEMSLLTGERRSATIAAQTRLEVLVLNKNVLAQPLKGNPTLVERMSQVLVERKSGLTAFQEKAARRGEPDRDHEDQARTLGAHIRKFFGI
jgi:small-conductance mechanosensitive channel/CRP-like cAMP-binding protein